VRPSRRLWPFAVVVGGVYLASMATEMRAEPHPLVESLSERRPLVIAHRGGALLWPENTLLAFHNAAALGADMIELDVWASRDGVPMVIHDAAVDRTTDGSGDVREMMACQVRVLDAAHRWSPPGEAGVFPYRGRGVGVPTLEEVFEALPDMPMTVEIKQVEPSMVDEVARLIGRFGRESRTLVASFDAGVLRALRKGYPGIATSAARQEGIAFAAMHRARLDGLYRPPFVALQVPEHAAGQRVVTRRLAERAHAKGLHVHVWTVNDPVDMRRLLDLGVDGIITDRPDLALRELGRGGDQSAAVQ
jgi:glycerophosphoryl diester phosphodiesterase